MHSSLENPHSQRPTMMHKLKTVLLFLGIILMLILDILIYWNHHLYYKAVSSEDEDEKIQILEKANRIHPYNDLVYFELGKIFFDRGYSNLDNQAASLENFMTSASHFTRSIQINPSSQFSHFQFGRTLQYLDLLTPEENFDYLHEYRNTVDLVGFDSELYANVIRLFISRWAQLDEVEKTYVSGLFTRLWEDKNDSILHSLLQLWEMEVSDYRMMDEIIPKTKWAYNIYAKYLGERSLDLQERFKFLARSDYIDFQAALEEFKDAENDYFYRRIRTAQDKFIACLGRLERLRFYQDLTQTKLIDISEYNSIHKSCILHIIKCLTDTGAEKSDIWPYLSKFLDFENELGALSDLENLLIRQGYFVSDLDRNLNDLELLSNQLYFHLKQNKFREIVRIGRAFESSYVIIPEKDKPTYVRILTIIGDAFMSIDNLYDASDFFHKAYEVDPKRLETLLKIRLNLEKRDEQAAIGAVLKEIEQLLSPKLIRFREGRIEKSESLRQVLQFDASNINLNLTFRGSPAAGSLVSVVFNNRMYWEGYLESDTLSLSMETLAGQNEIVIHSISRALFIEKIEWSK